MAETAQFAAITSPKPRKIASKRDVIPTLRPRHHKFILELRKNGGNITQAAISIGLNPDSAYTSGSRIFRRPDVQAELMRLAENDGITQAYVLNGVRAIADCDKSKAQDKLRAYELLGKYLKLWTDKVELDVSDLADRVAKARIQANQQVAQNAENGPFAQENASLAQVSEPILLPSASE